MGIAELTGFLAPFIPYLLDKGRTLGERAVSAVETEAWAFARRIWDRLGPAVEERPDAQAAAEAVAADPGDEQAVVALMAQLERLLADHALLAAQITELLRTPEANVVEVHASGGSFASGGNVSESTIILGSQNRIER